MKPIQLRALIRHIGLLPIRAYRTFISPLLPPSCRYTPSCSTYALDAINTHGLVKGTLLLTWRLLRCNPWSHGGVDHVPEIGQWKPTPWEPPDDWVGHGEGEWIPMGLPESLTPAERAQITYQDTRSLENQSNEAQHTTDHPATAGRPPKTQSSTNVRSHACSN